MLEHEVFGDSFLVIVWGYYCLWLGAYTRTPVDSIVPLEAPLSPEPGSRSDAQTVSATE